VAIQFFEGRFIVNILHIINSANPAGGGPIEGVKQLGITLVSQGHNVEIASLDSPTALYLEQCPLPVYGLGPTTLKYAFGPRLIPWLRANRNRYDAVVVNGIWQFHSLATWRALRNSSTPYVLFPHGMLDPWFKKRYPLKHLKKWMYWPWAEYRVLRDAQAVLFTCEEERVLARQSFWLYRCNEVVVHYGTAKPTGSAQLEVSEFFGRYPELRGKKLALFMGRIHPKKGCDLLIEAFAKVLAEHSEWHLVIAGPDQVGWQKKLQHRAELLGIASRITWAGMISGSMKWGALRAGEVFVLPSHQENFGIAVAEALAAGTPALISNKVNIWREVQADGAGLVAEDTFAGTCGSFRSYLALPEEKKLAMRQLTRQCFERRFEIKKAARTLHEVLASVTGIN
jgi:glycosyltransferase involved in cell wall biosynthesis